MELFSLINHVGIVYGVGASTFAIIFYFKALEDGVLDASEKNFMHAVYFVIRIGMFILVISEVVMLILAFHAGPAGIPYLQSSTLWFRLMILGIINANAILMEKRYMPMWLGPALAGGSWYSYFFIDLFKPTYFSFGILLLLYIAFVILFIYFLKAVKRVYLEKKSLF